MTGGFNPMKPPILSTLFLMMPLLLSILVSSYASLVSGRCRGDQQSLLLQLKHELSFNFSPSYPAKRMVYKFGRVYYLQSSHEKKMAKWNSSTECCDWPGVSCDAGGLGRAIGLNLRDESIIGGLDNSTSLWSLEYLQVLDLSFNDFNTTIPTAVANLTNLRYLNLSNAGVFGQIPTAISRMSSLVSLDLSRDDWAVGPPLQLESPNLAALVQNLTRLTDLRLDGVNISARGNEWCQALASSLPNLRVLSMYNCLLSGPLHPSLSKLQSLSVIRLDINNFSSPVPDFFADFRNLTTLSLRSCGLVGKFPAKLLQLPSLQFLDLSNNKLLEGEFPDFPQNQYSMQTLVLDFTKFSGVLPPSLGNLGSLSHLDLGRCNFSGTIPKSLQNLTQLEDLDFSSNSFTGDLGTTRWESFQKLEYVDLSYNSFKGSIPPSLLAIPSLLEIDLSSNQLDGQPPEFSDAASSILENLYLSGNNLEGPIPRLIFELRTLRTLDLSSNRFKGRVQLNWFQALRNLADLDLSYNDLMVDVSDNNSIHFETLGLASCNLRKFPELGNQSMLYRLDLSGNNISGVVPRWILESPTLSQLNLSHNSLVGLEVPISLPNLQLLDMHDNQLHGKIPIVSSTTSIYYLDFSNNLFNVSIPHDIGNNLSNAYFSLSNNRLTGAIPASICNIASYLQVLDLSNNSLNGTIPSCLIENIYLSVLNLRGNKFNGIIPDTFQTSCNLQTLDLSENQLQGKIPESLQNCTSLQLLDLANNRISDDFPCFLGNIPDFRVLVLRNNTFQGRIDCPNLPGNWQNIHIVDLAFNNFSGTINGSYLASWREAMKGIGSENHDHLKVELSIVDKYYQDSITVTTKGLEMELVKILKEYTSLDFSSNNFNGPIPEIIGEFSGLYFLNFSHNAFTGKIPSVFGHLSHLESLDLSDNNLGGQIPPQLSGLTFLSVLNLSNNNLVGSIPTGRQLQTFDNTSYSGNPGLCGSPLTKPCSHSKPPGAGVHHGKPGKRIHWTSLSIEFGFTFGLGAVILPAAFWPSFRLRYWPRIDSLILRMFPRLYDKDYNNRLRRRRR